MTRVRVESSSISLDGYAAGPNQDVDNPLGTGGPDLQQWLILTRTIGHGEGASFSAFLPHSGGMMKILIETEINAPLRTVWDAWVTPEDITRWNFAIDDWCCPRAELALEPGGRFNYRMEANDGSAGFDFEGEFTEVHPYESIQYSLGDGRGVEVRFVETRNGVKVIETFEAEDENSAEEQRQGWLSILNNFRKHVEIKCNP